MHRLSKAALVAAVASLLGACAGNGGSVTPQAVVPQSVTPVSTSSSDFSYVANPPMKFFKSESGVKAQALPSPSQCVQAFGETCYLPSEMRTAYNVPSSLTGAGQTIVIVDAFGSPTIQDDLAIFDAVMGLPAPPAFSTVYPTGQPASANDGWAGETSLDVEWAHAIAPGAKIVLVVAKTNLGSDLHAAEAYAIANHLGNVISMSFGAPESAIPSGKNNTLLQHADALYQQAKAAHITMVAGAGDTGATDGVIGGTPVANFPASDPLVTGVGGTSLFMSDAGQYQGETVWNDSVAATCPLGCPYGLQPGATGGAPSIIFKTPSYQHNFVKASTRYVSDVSYNAGLYTAVLVFMSFDPAHRAAGFYFVGGTSEGAPQWAGIVALANQRAGHPLGFINQALYNVAKGASYHAAFHDITVGNNDFFQPPGFNAAPGYDIPTGLGSPNVGNLIPALISAAAQ